MSDGPTITLEQLSQLFDLTPRRVQQLTSEGVVIKVASGRYDLLRSVRGYVRYLRDRSMRGDVSSETFTHQRARLTKTRADTAELERARMAGELIPIGEVLAVVGAVHTTVKTRFRGLGAKAAPLLEGMSVAERKEAIDKFVDQCLDELAKADAEFDPPEDAASSGDPAAGDEAPAPLGAAAEAYGQPMG